MVEILGLAHVPGTQPPSLKVQIEPIFDEDLPFEPPHLNPQTQEEAVFLLAPCGFGALEATLHLIRAFNRIFYNRKQIQDSGYILDDRDLDSEDNERVRENTNTLVTRWIKEKPTFFSGLPKMADWLQSVYFMARGEDSFPYRCVYNSEYEEIAKTDYDTLPRLGWLARELVAISHDCDDHWSFRMWLSIALQYVGAITMRNGHVSDRILKKELWDTLNNNRLFNASFIIFTDGDYSDWVMDQDAVQYMQWIKTALGNDKITLATIIEVIRKPLGLPPIAPVTAVLPELASGVNQPTDSPHDALRAAADSSSAEIAKNFLQSIRQVNREFFIWFCVAYVEVNFVGLEDAKTEAQKITSWTIYEKMRELNDGKDIKPIQKTMARNQQKDNVSSRVSRCKSRLREKGLPIPKGESEITKEGTVQCLKYLLKIPQIAKYFDRAEFSQRLIKQMDTETAKGQPNIPTITPQ